MVDIDTQKLQSYLEGLGFSARHARIYRTLTEKGPLTALEVARNTGIARTTVYRELQDLQAQQAIIEVVSENTTRYQAASPDLLRRRLETKHTELDRLTQEFPLIQDYLRQQINRRQPDTQVRFYRGQDGIRTMITNILAAKSEIVGYTHRDIDTAVGHDFAQEFYIDMLQRNIHLRDIYSDAYIDSVGSIENALQPPINHPKWSQLVTSRYLPKEKLDIPLQLDIYNDIIAIYNWHQDEVFGIEIHNPKVAHLQRQLFHLIWPQALTEDRLKDQPSEI